MSQQPSKIFYGDLCPSSAGSGSSLPTFVAHGAPDDHLRLITLIAHDFKNMGRGDPDAAQACLQRNTPWHSRIDAFETLLWSLKEQPIACIVDIDALEPASNRTSEQNIGVSQATGLSGVETATSSELPAPHSRPSVWNDATKRERDKTLRHLLDSIDRGGWTLVRPYPEPAFSERLVDVDTIDVDDDIASSSTPDLTDSDAALSTLPRALRNLAEGLVRIGFESHDSLGDLLESCEPEQYADVLLETAYDALTSSIRRTAQRIAIQRGPQRFNGCLGAFNLTESTNKLTTSIPRRDVNKLREAGWFAGQDDSLLMHSVVRQFLAKRAQLAMPEQQENDHRWLGNLSQKNQYVTQQLEIHHHAIMAGNPNRAVETALYYGSDLRQLALRLSQDGHYKEAANLYQTILEKFDNTDAYSWEYLGYNLARQHHHSSLTPSAHKAILEAFEKACSLDADNPLYRGRLVGFRASRGEDVSADFHRWMTLFGRKGGAGDDEYFARSAIQGFRAGGRYDELRKLVRYWRSRLRNIKEIPDHWLQI